MKTIFTLCFITLVIANNQTIAQSKSKSHTEDSLTNLICKKWEVDYLMLGDIKMSMLPNAEEINYQFNKDKTLSMSGRDSRGLTKGMWCYDKKKKTIRLTIKGKSNTTILSVNDKELVLLADTKGASDKNLPEVKLVYKLRQDYNTASATVSLASN